MLDLFTPGKGIQQRAVAEADLEIREDPFVGDSQGFEVFQSPPIFAKALMIEGDHPAQQTATAQGRNSGDTILNHFFPFPLGPVFLYRSVRSNAFSSPITKLSFPRGIHVGKIQSKIRRDTPRIKAGSSSTSC